MKNICWDCEHLEEVHAPKIRGKVYKCKRLVLRVFPDIEPNWYRLCPAFQPKKGDDYQGA
jgi:hypothetical protein